MRRRALLLAALLGVPLVVLAIVLLTGGRSGAGSASSTGARSLVRSDGPPPSVATENRAPGSTGWRLAPRRSSTGRVEGYVSEQDVRPGERETLYVNAPGARRVRVALYRMGWYGGRGGRLVLRSGPLRVVRQPPCRHRGQTGLTECRWRPTLGFRIPSAWASGVYVAKLGTDRGAERECLFVLEAAHPGALVAQISTATYEAYNDWGGDSLYPGALPVRATGTRQGVEVSYDRPYDTSTGAGQFFTRDVALVRYLERSGYPVTYTTNTAADLRGAELGRARALLDVGHSEYWSDAGRRAFSRALDAGVSLVFLSSDTLAWRVRFAPATAASSEAGRPDHRIVAYKEHAALDPVRSRPSGAFPGLGAGLTGSAYHDCITARLSRGTGPPVYAYSSWSPAPALRPAWLFRGTGFTPGATVPGIVGYELDEASPAAPARIRTVGGGTAPCLSGRRGRAISTLYRARSGALVFASGTLGWQLGLSPVPETSPDAPRTADRRLVRMTDNLLRRVLAGHPAGGQ